MHGPHVKITSNLARIWLLGHTVGRHKHAPKHTACHMRHNNQKLLQLRRHWMWRAEPRSQGTRVFPNLGNRLPECKRTGMVSPGESQVREGHAVASSMEPLGL